MPTAERALLHRGGQQGTWGSLGLWAADEDDYAQACRALARVVAQAAGLKAGDEVLSLACGAGDELKLWLQDFRAALACGVELDGLQVQAARRLLAVKAGVPPYRVQVLQGSALDLPPLGLDAARFDCVLCVDAAYHLRPRQQFLQAAWSALRPGGMLAYTDLSLAPRATPHQGLWGGVLLRGAARLCGLAGDELQTADAQVQGLHAVGFVDVHTRPLDSEVLGGFAAYVRRQGSRVLRSAWHPDWRRPALTAALIGPCQAAGLGYVLLAARKPGPAASACKAAATPYADRTALSSSGTPASA